MAKARNSLVAELRCFMDKTQDKLRVGPEHS
jgi:hypothetical protein